MDDTSFDRLLGRLGAGRRDTSRLELGFETRVMARIREDREQQPAFFRMAWRLAPVFVSLFVVVSSWVYITGNDPDIDHIAHTNARHEGIQLVKYMSGD